MKKNLKIFALAEAKLTIFVLLKIKASNVPFFILYVKKTYILLSLKLIESLNLQIKKKF